MSLLIALILFAAAQTPATSERAIVAGQVLEGGTGAPVAGAQVNVFPAPTAPPAPGSMVAFRPLSATTDGEGRFQVTGLEPGRYRISAMKPGFAMPLDGGAQLLELGAGERRTVDLSLQRGAVIVGRVLDEAGEPLADARVIAMRRMPLGPPGARVSEVMRPAGPAAQSNDLGEFRLFGLPAGEYYVQVAPRPDFSGSAGGGSAPRARTMLPTFFPSTPDDSSAEAIPVRAGQTSETLEIKMVGAPAFEISGTVADESGRPVANAMVKLSQENASNRPMYGMPPWSQARTDRSGRFTLGNVTPGAYVLLAIAPETVASAPAGAGGGTSVSAMSWSGVGATIGGSVGMGVTTETSNGVTVQYRDDRGTRVAITIDQSNVADLQVTVRLR